MAFELLSKKGDLLFERQCTHALKFDLRAKKAN